MNKAKRAPSGLSSVQALYRLSLQKWPWLKVTAAIYSACLRLLRFQWRSRFISTWKSLWGDRRRPSLFLNPVSWALSGLTEADRSLPQAWPPRREEDFTNEALFAQDPPPTSPYYTDISSFKCLLTGCVCKRNGPTLGWRLSDYCGIVRMWREEQSANRY